MKFPVLRKMLLVESLSLCFYKLRNIQVSPSPLRDFIFRSCFFLKLLYIDVHKGVLMKTTNTKKVTLPNGEVIPVIFSAESEHSAGTLLLRKVAAKAGTRAVQEAFSHGVSVTVAKNGKIVKIHPDGTESIIGVL